KHLLGENTDSDRFFNVFTVSSRQYRLIQEEEEEERILDLDETELPMLIEHMKKLIPAIQRLSLSLQMNSGGLRMS
ncbi:nuclear GTPase SLIP-GC-like isoform X2, partial [Arapaima gigas]